MTPNQDIPSDQDTLSNQVAELIQWVRSGEEAIIQRALISAKDLGNPPAFQKYLSGLIALYQLAFKSTPKKLDAAALNKLFQLTELTIANSDLTVLPESLGELHHLQRLFCRFSSLRSLPESIGQLHQLKKLYCIDNQLQTFPESIGQLKNLQLLDCSNNQLETLPQSLGQLRQLKYLHCSDNQLRALEAVLKLAGAKKEVPKVDKFVVPSNRPIHDEYCSKEGKTKEISK